MLGEEGLQDDATSWVKVYSLWQIPPVVLVSLFFFQWQYLASGRALNSWLVRILQICPSIDLSHYFPLQPSQPFFFHEGQGLSFRALYHYWSYHHPINLNFRSSADIVWFKTPLQWNVAFILYCNKNYISWYKMPLACGQKRIMCIKAYKRSSISLYR
jgi:hypothetical protein